MSHKATPEQWALIASDAADCDLHCLCLLKLRDRIVALEVQHESYWSRIVKLEETANRQGLLDSSPAPASGLVERVQKAISDVEGQRVIADGAAARWLREEVERG
jgi:hypothetical protein